MTGWRRPLAGALMLVPAAAHAAPARLGGGGDLSVSPWRIGVAFILCAAAAYLAVLWIRKHGSVGALRLGLGKLPLRARSIEIVETRRLSTHADISLVREGGHEYLLLLFAGGCQVLREGVAEAPDEARS